MSEKIIACTVCGTDFSFSDEEQAFYQEKGFQEPRKCRPCRQAAKANRGGGGGRSGGYGGGGGRSSGGYGQRPPRQLFDAVCSGCGVQTQVPFQPTGERPVYCRECYQASKQAYY